VALLRRDDAQPRSGLRSGLGCLRCAQAYAAQVWAHAYKSSG